jgi:ribosomal protein L37AE/L43A
MMTHEIAPAPRDMGCTRSEKTMRTDGAGPIAVERKPTCRYCGTELFESRTPELWACLGCGMYQAERAGPGARPYCAADDDKEKGTVGEVGGGGEGGMGGTRTLGAAHAPDTPGTPRKGDLSPDSHLTVTKGGSA